MSIPYLNSCPKVDCSRKNDCRPFRKIVIPAVLGDDSEDSEVAPENGAYCDALVEYEANGAAYFYSSDGIPTKLTYTTTDYNALTNKPTINGVTLEGNQSSSSLGLNITIDSELSETSTNPVQNSTIYAAIGNIESILNTLNIGAGV